MKKFTLPYLLLLLPVLTLAQAKPAILKDAWKKVHGIASSFEFNDHQGIIQVTLTDTSFELMAMDNKLSVLWRDTLKGTGVTCGKFRGKILAVSDSAFSNRKGNINPYYAFLIDPASGKIILQNQIYAQKAKDDEQATAFFSADGNDFTLAVQQADVNHSWILPYKNKIEDLTLISLNERLEPAYLKPRVPDENYVSMAMNNSGDFFLLTIGDEKSGPPNRNGHGSTEPFSDKRTLLLRRYEHGSTEPSEPILQPCDDVDKQDLRDAAGDMAPSETDRTVVYLSIGHTNTDDDREIITARFNFATRQAQALTEVFTHKHVRDVEKSYVPVNNDFSEADLGSAKKQMRVHYVAMQDGKLVTVSAEVYFVTLNNVTTFYGNALVINGYDADLKPLFQQIMPVQYSSGSPLTTGYALGTNELKIVSNSDSLSVYGRLDLATGKWSKLVRINADGGDSDQHFISFNDACIVPFIHRRAFGSKLNIDLVLAGYQEP